MPNQISFPAKLWPCSVLKRRHNREGASPSTLVPHFFRITSLQRFLTCFPLDSSGFSHMSEWLWVPTFCPGQGQSQPGEFVPNSLRKVPELTSHSVSLGWETWLPLTELCSYLLFLQALEAKKKRSNPDYMSILEVCELSLSAEQAKISIRLLTKTKEHSSILVHMEVE